MDRSITADCLLTSSPIPPFPVPLWNMVIIRSLSPCFARPGRFSPILLEKSLQLLFYWNFLFLSNFFNPRIHFLPGLLIVVFHCFCFSLCLFLLFFSLAFVFAFVSSFAFGFAAVVLFLVFFWSFSHFDRFFFLAFAFAFVLSLCFCFLLLLLLFWCRLPSTPSRLRQSLLLLSQINNTLLHYWHIHGLNNCPLTTFAFQLSIIIIIIYIIYVICNNICNISISFYYLYLYWNLALFVVFVLFGFVYYFNNSSIAKSLFEFCFWFFFRKNVFWYLICIQFNWVVSI